MLVVFRKKFNRVISNIQSRQTLWLLFHLLKYFELFKYNENSSESDLFIIKNKLAALLGA